VGKKQLDNKKNEKPIIPGFLKRKYENRQNNEQRSKNSDKIRNQGSIY